MYRYILVLILFACGSVYAQTTTASGTHYTASASVSVTLSGGQITWSASHSGLNSGNAASAYLYRNGGFVYGDSRAEGHSSSGTAPAVPGDVWYFFVYMVGNDSTTTVEKTFVVPALTQQVTANLPGSQAHEAGESLNGQATGAQGGNQYQYSISGSASVAGNPNTGAFVVTASTTPGAYTLQVWAEEGGGYGRSNDATVEGVVVDTKKNKVTLRLDNRGNNAQYFWARQDGVRVAQWFLLGDEMRVVTIEVPTLSPVSIETEGKATLIDGVWTLTQDPVITPNATFEPERVPGDSTPPVAPVDAVGAPTPQGPTAESQKTVWTSINTTNTTSNVTNANYAEGTDKIVAAIKGLQTGLGNISGLGPGSGGTIDDPGEGDFELEGYDGENLPSLVGGVIDRLPTAPQILAPELTAASPIFVSPTYQIGDLVLQKNYDLTPYIGAIAPFRMIAAGCVGIMFFILYVRTIKGAFAG